MKKFKAHNIPRGEWRNGMLPDPVDRIGTIYKIMSNYWYTVIFTKHQTPDGIVIQLKINRNDKAPINDYRELQRIKDELIGVDQIAVEVYPRSQDANRVNNERLLWVLPAGSTMPFGQYRSLKENMDATRKLSYE